MEEINRYVSLGLKWFVIIVGSSIVIYILVKLLIFINKQIMRYQIINQHKNGVLLKITLPRYRHQSDAPNERVSQIKTKTNVAEQMFAELRGIVPSDWRKHLIFRDSLSFEIVATATEISFYVFCSKNLQSFVTNTIFAAYPEADIYESKDYYPDLIKNKLSYGYVRLIGSEYSPIRTYDTLVNDSLNSILNKLTNLKGEEIVAIQTYVTPVSGSWRNKAYSFLNYLKNNQADSQKQSAKTDNQGQILVPQSNPELTIDKDAFNSVEQKMSKKGYLVGIRIVSSSPDKNIAQANFNLVARSYSQFDVSPLTSFQSSQLKISLINFLKLYQLRIQPSLDPRFMKQQFIANTAELASLYHFPGEEVQSPKIDWQKYKTATIPTDIAKEGLFMGYNYFRGSKTPTFISPPDRRRHMYFVGQTGVGKTEYLKNMFLQDVKNGNGVCYIDPHGDAAEDLLQKIPANRIKDVIYWNPGDFEYPMGLNILDAKTEEQKNLIINSFIGLLYKLYDPNHQGMMGPMLERTVRNTMLTAMSEDGNTLVEVLRLLTSDDFAKSKIDKIKDPLIKTYWTEQMAKTTDFHKSETLGYYISKFDRFVSDSNIRNIIGQSHSAINFTEIINTNKILIINLSKGLIGEENMSFLGMLLIPKFLTAAMERENIPEDQRKDFYLYVDEFQNFATSDFVNILSEARKYRLNLIIANQYISQIQDDIREAVFGNVGTVGAFRVGIDDAKYLVRHFSPIFNEFDMINNGIGNLYIKLLSNGKPSEPFSVSLSWEEAQAIPKNPKIAQIITEIARVKYAKPKIAVESEIIRRSGLSV